MCGLHGELELPPTSQHFCPRCFSINFEKRVLKRIPRHIRGHSIAVALSGGKDSTTLLHVLNKFRRKLKIPTLFAIVLEEENLEIQATREKIIDELKATYPDIQYIQKSFTELFGYSLPKLVQQSDSKGLRFTPCAICGILHRHGILRIALDLRVDFIAMGNTIDDEAETVFLNIIRGNLEKNFRDTIQYRSVNKQPLPTRIKPLEKISEKTIRDYCRVNQLSIMKKKCTFAKRSFRSQITQFLIEIEKKNPRVLYNVTSPINKDMLLKTSVVQVHKCETCSSYSPKPECSACRIVRQIMS